MKRSFLAGGLLLPLLALLALWGFGEGALPPGHPGQGAAVVLVSPAGDALLRQACFDCHSEETRYPWYVRLPGASFLMGRHVRAARAALNFSRWSLLSPAARREALTAALDMARQGDMPHRLYARFHPVARLEPGRIGLLEREIALELGEDAGGGLGVAPEDAWEGCPAVDPPELAAGELTHDAERPFAAAPGVKAPSRLNSEPPVVDDPAQCSR